MRLRVTILLSFLLTISFPVQSIALDLNARQVRAIGDRVDSLAEHYRSHYSIPGISIAILLDPYMAIIRGYGFADSNKNHPVGSETAFGCGSIDKHVIAAAVMRQVEAGMLELDDPVSQYFATFPHYGDTIRISHLLSQTSGLPELTIVSSQEYDTTITDPGEQYAALLRGRSLYHAPGVRHCYSNTNFDLFWYILPKLTGNSYEAVLNQLLGSAGYSRMFVWQGGHPSEQLAVGHRISEGQIRPVLARWGLYSSAVDLAGWVRALASGRVVNAANFRQMTTPARLNDNSESTYGFGLDLRPYRGHQQIWHTGHADGFSSTFSYFPHDSLVIVVMTNQGDFYYPEAIAMKISDIVYGLSPTPLDSLETQFSPAQIYDGVYDCGSVWIGIEIGAEGGNHSLDFKAPGSDRSDNYFSVPVRYVGEGKFLGVDEPVALKVEISGKQEDELSMVADVVGCRWTGFRMKP